MLSHAQEEYVSHLQSQIKDLERYIVFLQAKHTSTPTTPDVEAPPTPRFSRDLSHDSTPSTPDSKRPSQPTISLDKPAHMGRGKKHVRFARESWEGAFEDPPAPLYRLSMAQLDGVDCVIDSTRCEWEKMDQLGRALPKAPRVSPLSASFALLSISLPLPFPHFLLSPLSSPPPSFSHSPSPLLLTLLTLSSLQDPDDLRLSLTVMRKTLALMQVLTLCQCGGSFHCLPKYVADGKRKRYHMALQSLEMAVDKISIITTALHEPALPKDSVSTMGGWVLDQPLIC